VFRLYFFLKKWKPSNFHGYSFSFSFFLISIYLLFFSYLFITNNRGFRLSQLLIFLALCFGSCHAQRSSTSQLHEQVKLKVMLRSSSLLIILSMIWCLFNWFFYSFMEKESLIFSSSLFIVVPWRDGGSIALPWRDRVCVGQVIYNQTLYDENLNRAQMEN
jgi:hypothetical protein